MGVISVEQTDRMYWLGRYAERVYTTMKLYFRTYDTMIDAGEDYDRFCRALEIPNIYTSKEDFISRYSFDEEDVNSLMSNLKRAYDNAVVLREEIGTEALAYIQLAVYAMQRAEDSQAPLIEFQKVVDNLMAFNGICDDQILSENVRNLLKVGKRVERIDLYARLHESRENLEREICRLAGRIDRCSLKYHPESLDSLKSLIGQKELDYHRIIRQIEQIL